MVVFHLMLALAFPFCLHFCLSLSDVRPRHLSSLSEHAPQHCTQGARVHIAAQFILHRCVCGMPLKRIPCLSMNTTGEPPENSLESVNTELWWDLKCLTDSLIYPSFLISSLQTIFNVLCAGSHGRDWKYITWSFFLFPKHYWRAMNLLSEMGDGVI